MLKHIGGLTKTESNQRIWELGHRRAKTKLVVEKCCNLQPRRMLHHYVPHTHFILYTLNYFTDYILYLIITKRKK